MKKYIESGLVEKCPKCKEMMVRRKHRELTAKILTQPYYFSEWDYCWRCQHLQHYEKFKVWASNERATFLKEMEERDNLFKNL